MGRGKTLSQEERGRILALKEESYSNREIARRIRRDPWTIHNFLKNQENYGKNCKGRTSRATTERERRLILREASNTSASPPQIASKVRTSASVRTVRRIIQQCPHLRRKKLQKKNPRLQQRHKEARLEFCRDHFSWKNEWENVIFSDEKKFNLDGPDGYRFYFHDLRKEEKFLSRRHSALGTVMVWGAISYYGTIDLVILEGRQNSAKYIDLLRIQRVKINEVFEGHYWIYQQDNASIHTSAAVRTWFESNSIEALKWPALSPDLNIIENLWGWLSRRFYSEGRQYNSRKDLIEAIKKAWKEVPLDIIRNLYNSINNRLVEVVRNNGGHTHYQGINII